jgi:hypothetical protein
MLRFCLMLFALLLIIVAWFIVTTTGQLADPVATHFGSGYLANGWMTRDGYLAFSLGFSVFLPVVIAALVGWLPRIASGPLSLPNRDYWLSPERRTATLGSITVRAIALGGLFASFMAGVHWLILQANATVPTQLPARLFWAMLIAFLAIFTVWIGMFWSKCRNVAG